MYGYHDTAYTMQPYFDCLDFPDLMGGKGSFIYNVSQAGLHPQPLMTMLAAQ